MVRTNRLVRASEGLAGGVAGALSKNVLNPDSDNRELPKKAHVHMEVKKGDIIHHVVSGSGGHGDPLERDPERVFNDLKDGKITIEHAKKAYGVAISSEDEGVDWEETTVLRRDR